MVFSSISFLYYFLPCVIFLYFVVPNKFKNIMLLVASLLFYFWGEQLYILVMILAIVSAYIHGLLIEKYKEKKKIFLVSSISISVIILMFFKYTNFFVDNVNTILKTNIIISKIALPIGISFYTFQLMSYVIDVYTEKAKVQKNFINLALYISLFPQLIAGPIVRYSSVERELEKRETSFENFATGIERFIFGLSKKVLIANSLAELCNIFNMSNEKSIMFYWIYGISCMLYIYFDFSGYSDMAIGLGRIFGFHFLENFNYPYISKSITEFWRRWHISLGTWFRDYVYIPLGGSRVSKLKFIRNIFIVWFLTGMWHGAEWTFIVWGLYFAVILLIEKKFLSKILDKIPAIFSRLYVILIIMISFIIFDSSSLNLGINNIIGLFNFKNIPLVSNEAIYYLRSYFVLIVLGIILSTPILKNLYIKLSENMKLKKMLNIAEPILLVILLLVSTSYLIDGSFNPFLYFRF